MPYRTDDGYHHDLSRTVALFSVLVAFADVQLCWPLPLEPPGDALEPQGGAARLFLLPAMEERLA